MRKRSRERCMGQWGGGVRRVGALALAAVTGAAARCGGSQGSWDWQQRWRGQGGGVGGSQVRPAGGNGAWCSVAGAWVRWR